MNKQTRKLMELPPAIAGWTKYLQEYVDFITENGHMTGEDADRLALRSNATWTLVTCAIHDIGDLLVHPSSAHIYRLHRFVERKLLRRVVRGKTADRVFYYLPRPVPATAR